jgi:valyl-tRNA synthetase
MNDDATINSMGGEYEGMDRFEAREAIIEDLKERGLFIRSEPHRHAVGHCYRCHTMIEPRLSLQWFVEMKPLAAPAIEAVKDGRVRFYPERWTKVYLDWMENIRDWCISRQIWWGHRIPVYYCKRCSAEGSSLVDGRLSLDGDRSCDNSAMRNARYAIRTQGLIVSKSRPEKCPTCGGASIEQDPDVLDTWFSSWLWPFSTFGWPKESEDLKYFYPTNSLVTAQEIIFFWVARMIIAGIEFKGNIPFRDVYIHGTVRDITGTKMSKSLGNIIDPLDMIGRYGSDALRFSIISITAQGQDVYLGESKFELGRNFANKIWNASRFIMMNLKADETAVDLCEFYDRASLALAERWILSRFYSTLDHVAKCIDEYKFNEAANAIYEFLWHEFCDWYIEIVKPIIGERSSQVILFKVLEKSLRMLHPFMPFITEEIWQKLPRPSGAAFASIMIQPWPHLQKQMISKPDEEDMRKIIDLIAAVRNMRAAWNIDVRTFVSIVINLNDAIVEKLVSDNMSFVKSLAKISDLKLGRRAKPRNSAVSVVGNMEVYLPLEGLIDFEKENARLTKARTRMDIERRAIINRLGDKDFTSKAPEDVVEKQRSRMAELEVQIRKIEENLREIGA